jgi:hypothetical protein
MVKVLTLVALLTSVNTFASLAMKITSHCSLNLKDNRELQNYHYVLVRGVLSEISPYYMTPHRDYLKAKGVKTENIHIIGSSSNLKPEEAALQMNNIISRLSDKKIIFISHSKGALETLYYLNNQKDLGHIAKAYLINGPLDGASLYQLAYERDDIFVMNIARKAISKDYALSFSSQYVRKKLGNINSNSHLLKKIVIIQSRTKYSHVPFKYKITANLYRKVYGAVGDGLLLTSDHLPYVLKGHSKLCKVTLDTYHDELLKAFPWDKEKIKNIEYFLDRLLF